jgi:hypothetical protein
MVVRERQMIAMRVDSGVPGVQVPGELQEQGLGLTRLHVPEQLVLAGS